MPYPVDYGGVVDLFCKLPALHSLGIKIHLHCFDYGRGRQNELAKYCISVNYYKRNNTLTSLLSDKPFMVASRTSRELENNLLKDDYPILCEGVHSSFFIHDKRFSNRKKILRLHNVEYEYYRHLYESASGFMEKIFYKREAGLLKKYEASMAQKFDVILTVTHQDALTYTKKFNCKNVQHLPLFLPNDWKLNIKTGVGEYCLYNGDLSITANIKAVNFLLQHIVSALPEVNFIVAGKNPDIKLQHTIATIPNVQLMSNPTTETMDGLIADAQIHILPSFSSAGIKLKLLNALFNGRYCIANNDTLSGSGLDELCLVANYADEFIGAIRKLLNQPFTLDEIEKRKLILQTVFNNEVNAKKLVKVIGDS